MAVVAQVTHVRCKVMYRCVCARHCAVETDTQQGYQQRKLETNLGFYSVPTELMSLSHDDSHAITPYLGNKVICDWHTSNVHNWFRWVQRVRMTLGRSSQAQNIAASRCLMFSSIHPSRRKSRIRRLSLIFATLDTSISSSVFFSVRCRFARSSSSSVSRGIVVRLSAPPDIAVS